MTATKLKPCPFCGGEACIIFTQVEALGPFLPVAYHVCGLGADPCEQREDTIADWNRRVDQVNELFPQIGEVMRAAWNRRAKGRAK